MWKIHDLLPLMTQIALKNMRRPILAMGCKSVGFLARLPGTLVTIGDTTPTEQKKSEN